MPDLRDFILGLLVLSTVVSIQSMRKTTSDINKKLDDLNKKAEKIIIIKETKTVETDKEFSSDKDSIEEALKRLGVIEGNDKILYYETASLLNAKTR